MSVILHMPTPQSACRQFESFRASLPLPVAAARRGIGGYITLDFGQARDRDSLTGETQYDWHLWVYMCDWDLYKGDSRILWRRESDNALAGAILAQLTDEQLTGFEMDSEDDCFTLHFSGGYRLHMDPDFFDFDAGDDMFMLFGYGQPNCVSFNPKRRFYEAA